MCGHPGEHEVQRLAEERVLDLRSNGAGLCLGDSRPPGGVTGRIQNERTTIEHDAVLKGRR